MNIETRTKEIRDIAIIMPPSVLMSASAVHSDDFGNQPERTCIHIIDSFNQGERVLLNLTRNQGKELQRLLALAEEKHRQKEYAE